MSAGIGAGIGAASRAEDATTRRLRRLCLFIVVAACVEFVIATIGVQIHRLPQSTDFASYYLAGAQTRDHLSPYDHAAIIVRGRALGFEYNQFPFLYPPPFALAAQGLASLSFPRARQVWMVLASLALFAALAVTTDLVRRQAAALGIADRRLVWVLLAAFFPAALNSTSVHNDLRAGSVGCMLYLFLVLAARELVPPAGGGRPRNSILGGALAAAFLVKLTPAALLAWLGRRGAWRAVGVAAGLLTLTMLPAFAHWGPGILLDWWQHALRPSLQEVVPPHMNQSLDAYLARMLVANRWGTSWVDAPVVHRVLASVASLVIVLVTLRALIARRRPAALLPVEMGMVWLAILAVMRLTWVQTLCSMLFVGPVLLVVILRAAEREAPWARRMGVAACAGFFLSSAHLPILWSGLRHGPGVLLTGVHLFGVLILWGVSLVVLRHAAEFEPQATTAG